MPEQKQQKSKYTMPVVACVCLFWTKRVAVLNTSRHTNANAQDLFVIPSVVFRNMVYLGEQSHGWVIPLGGSVEFSRVLQVRSPRRLLSK